MNKKSLLVVAVVAAGMLVVGIAAGFHVGKRVTEARFSLDSLFTGAAVAERAAVLFYDGDETAASDALNSYLNFLDRVDVRRSRGETAALWLDARSTAFERMLTYTRLALLEERRTSPDTNRADDYWQRAERSATIAGVKESSRAGMRSIVGRLDSRTPPPAVGPTAR